MNKSTKDSIEHLNQFVGKIQNILDSENSDEELNFDTIMKNYGMTSKDLEIDYDNLPKVELKFKKVHEDAVSPKYNYTTDSGFDLHSTIDIEIPAFGRALIPTGLCFDIKDAHEIQVRSKSGLAINQGLMCLNSPGTVDNGYNGEVKAIIFNVNNHPVKINKGMKIAQAVLCPVVNGRWVNLTQTNEIENKDRNDKGFGSTGIQ